MKLKKLYPITLACLVLLTGAAKAAPFEVNECRLSSWDLRGSIIINCEVTVNNDQLHELPSPIDNPESLYAFVVAHYNNGGANTLGYIRSPALPVGFLTGTTIADLVRRGLLPARGQTFRLNIPLNEVIASSNLGYVVFSVRGKWEPSIGIIESPRVRIPINNLPLGCSIDAAGADNMEFNHGQLVKSAGGGSDTVSSNITLSCITPTAVRLSILNRADIKTSLKEVTSTIAFDGVDYTKVFGTVSGDRNIAVTSTVKWPAAGAASETGPFSGSGVILLDIP